jgi:phosphate-selective porin OprO/OprP
MLYKLEVDFNNADDPEYKDIYIGWKGFPHNQMLLLGNQKRPLGLDHLNSSRYNVFMERPLVVEAFNEDARRIGLAMYGYSHDERYNWRYGVYELENTSLDGRSIGDSMQMSGNARLASSPWYDERNEGRNYLHWAIAGMVAKPDGDASPADTNSNEARFRTRTENRSDRRWLDTGRIANAAWYEIAAVESMLNVGRLQIVGEYQTNWTQRDVGDDLFFHGGYVYVSYFLTGEHQPYDRQDGTIDRVVPLENFFLVDPACGRWGGWGAWQIAARYSYLDVSDSDILGGVGRNLTFGLNWFWTPYSKVQFNYIYGDVSQHEPVAGFASGNFHVIGVRFMVDF